MRKGALIPALLLALTLFAAMWTQTSTGNDLVPRAFLPLVCRNCGLPTATPTPAPTPTPTPTPTPGAVEEPSPLSASLVSNASTRSRALQGQEELSFWLEGMPDAMVAACDHRQPQGDHRGWMYWRQFYVFELPFLEGREVLYATLVFTPYVVTAEPAGTFSLVAHTGTFTQVLSSPTTWNALGEEVGRSRELSPDEAFEAVSISINPAAVGPETRLVVRNSCEDEASVPTPCQRWISGEGTRLLVGYR